MQPAQPGGFCFCIYSVWSAPALDTIGTSHLQMGCKDWALYQSVCPRMVQEDGRLLIHNHLRFTILYHRDPETDLSRIVGFEVEAFSVKHKYDGKWNADRPELKTCNSNSMKFVSEKDIKQEVKEGEEIVFTYDVTFKVGRPLAHGAALDRWFGQGSQSG